MKTLDNLLTRTNDRIIKIELSTIYILQIIFNRKNHNNGSLIRC